MYRVRAEKESIFPIDTSIFISELGKSYKEKLYTQQRWSGLYKYDYWPLTVLVGLGWTTYWIDSFHGVMDDISGGNVDVTLRHWLHRKPLPTKLRFAIDYQLQVAYNRFRYKAENGYLRLHLNENSYTLKDEFSGGILVGPSLTLTPTQRGYGQLSIYALLGYQIGGGKGLYCDNGYWTSQFTDAGHFFSYGFASTFGLSFAFKRIGIAGEFVINKHRYSYTVDGPWNKYKDDFLAHGLRAKLFVKIGK